MSTELTKRSQYLIRKNALWAERASWMQHWKEISEYIMPRSGRFFHTDRNKGDKRHNSILDSTGTRALRVLAAGMMAGMTSPARPWFRLATADEELMEYAPVKEWLDGITKTMRNIFARSNTYRSFHSMYEELGGYGTAADIVVDNFDTVIHHHGLTAGEYAISTNNLGQVDTIVREFDMTVGQMVQEFGEENLSAAVRNLYKDGRGVDKWVPVIHIVEPRMKRDYGKRDNMNMPFKSCYFEAGGNEDKFLRESGFKRFPGLVPRWAATGGDMYGNSPGMEALGDIKQLQHAQLRKSQAIDYKVKPPLQLPAGLKESPHSTLPGGTAYFDSVGQHNVIKSMFEVNLEMAPLIEDIRDIRDRINSTFYVDLFLMLAQDDRSGVTAREIAERHEEKLLMLGPTLERLHNEFLKPFIDLTFERMVEAGLVPPPPEELQGMDLNVEFVSMLAQAQRAIGTQSVDRLIGTIGSIATLQANTGRDPSVLDKLDVDQVVDAYSEMLGVDPQLIVADDKVALIRKQRAEQQAAMQKQAEQAQQAEMAQKLASTPTEGDNALSQVMGQFSGYSVPGTI